MGVVQQQQMRARVFNSGAPGWVREAVASNGTLHASRKKDPKPNPNLTLTLSPNLTLALALALALALTLTLTPTQIEGKKNMYTRT